MEYFDYVFYRVAKAYYKWDRNDHSTAIILGQCYRKVDDGVKQLKINCYRKTRTAKSLLDYRVIDGATGLSKTGARIWEQTLINQYGLGKNGGQLMVVLQKS